MRLVAQERGVPCQVTVTIALRTGSPFAGSMATPEITPWASTGLGQHHRAEDSNRAYHANQGHDWVRRGLSPRKKFHGEQH